MFERGNFDHIPQILRSNTVHSNTGTFVFAWSGQKIYLEIMSEMRDASEFPKSLYASYPVIFTFYACVVVIGYAFQGRKAPGYILETLNFSGTKSFANVMMFLHMQISFTLNIQVRGVFFFLFLTCFFFFLFLHSSYI